MPILQLYDLEHTREFTRTCMETRMTSSETSVRPAPTELVADGAMSVAEAVRFTGLSRSVLYESMTAGELVYLKHGARRLIPRAALVTFLARGLVAT